MKKYKNIKIYFLRVSVALCPKKVILVVNQRQFIRQSTLIVQK